MMNADLIILYTLTGRHMTMADAVTDGLTPPLNRLRKKQNCINMRDKVMCSNN